MSLKVPLAPPFHLPAMQETGQTTDAQALGARSRTSNFTTLQRKRWRKSARPRSDNNNNNQPRWRRIGTFDLRGKAEAVKLPETF